MLTREPQSRRITWNGPVLTGRRWMCSDRRTKDSSAQGTGQPDDKWDARVLTVGCMAACTNKEPNGEEISEHLLMLVHSEEGQLCLSKDFQFFIVMTWCMVPETHAWKGQRNQEQRSQRQLLEFGRFRALEPWIQSQIIAWSPDGPKGSLQSETHQMWSWNKFMPNYCLREIPM